MDDQAKGIAGNVVTAVGTALVLGIIGWATGVFSAGNDALNEARIKEVVNGIMVTDTGATYAQTLASINTNLTVISTQVVELTGEVDDLEDAVLALASE